MVLPTSSLQRSMLVLLVEDNPVNRLVAARLLERLGHRCDQASNSNEALAMVKGQPYDMILMDVQMPGIDGIETARRIQELLGPRTPYIVAMTANAFPGDRERCMDAGMDDYLPKPVRLDALAKLLDPTKQEEA